MSPYVTWGYLITTVVLVAYSVRLLARGRAISKEITVDVRDRSRK